MPVTTPYYREKHARRAKRRPGLYSALVVLGIYDRCTPKLASDASRAVAMHSSLAEAQAQPPLRRHRPGYQDPPLDRLSLRCAGPSGPAERGVRSAGPRDREAGGRLPRRGPRPREAQEAWPQDEEGAQTDSIPTGRNRSSSSCTWSATTGDRLRRGPRSSTAALPGPEAVFALLVVVRAADRPQRADKVLFIADGAPWIWQRIQRLIAALGLSPTQVLGLIDFYHAAKQLSDAVKLRRWSATQRTRWLNRTRGLLKRARVDEVITALRELCRGRTAGKIRTHLNYS